MRSLLLGSVSTAIAEHAACPVAVVRPAHDGARGTGRVVVGVDGGATSGAALDMAFDLAAAQEQPLHVVTSWSDVEMYVDRYSYEQHLQEADANERLLAESLAGYAEKCPNMTITRDNLDGSPVHVLVSLSHEAAAIVVGSRGLTGLKAVLGSVSRDVVERAACTVVVARS